MPKTSRVPCLTVIASSTILPITRRESVNCPLWRLRLFSYPYDVSNEFPELGTGGRSATGGPIYHRSDFVNPVRMGISTCWNMAVAECRGAPIRESRGLNMKAGNRAPIVHAASNLRGGIPLFRVLLSSQGTEDYDGDDLRCQWEVTGLAGNTRTY
ncbi:MAG: hypothetical protein M2R46_03789 [Verrucomicrobia subdivision 3 bacterium]|nr:hypothetical protein [Limisphaerales bacterium]